MWAGFRLITCWAALVACSDVLAAGENLGSVGRTWPVEETDLISVMQARLQAKVNSGEWENLQGQLRTDSQRRADEPPSLRLPRASAERTWRWDPSIEVPYAVNDAKGSTIFPARQRVSALQVLKLSRKLVFVDAGDVQQLRWLRQHATEFQTGHKVILTGGRVSIASQALAGSRVWFDQGGKLVSEFGITAVPVIAQQDGDVLLLRELKP